MGRIVGFIPKAEKPAEPKTKADFKAILDEKGIEYPSDATLAELKALVPED